MISLAGGLFWRAALTWRSGVVVTVVVKGGNVTPFLAAETGAYERPEWVIVSTWAFLLGMTTFNVNESSDGAVVTVHLFLYLLPFLSLAGNKA